MDKYPVRHCLDVEMCFCEPPTDERLLEISTAYAEKTHMRQIAPREIRHSGKAKMLDAVVQNKTINFGDI